MKNMKQTHFTEKERLTTPKKIIALNTKTGETIWMTDKVFPQHFYPLSIKDYCEAIRTGMKKGIDRIPILSVSSKDYPHCDFNCVDCLACPSRKWAMMDNNIKYPVIPIEIYEKVLKEIARYSSERGFDHIRFEICGEGNPDLYRDRIRMIEYATNECGMKIVYVSTGSRMSDDLMKCLSRNAACIRISFPGISPHAYRVYSGQNKEHFTYEDGVHLVDKLTSMRAQFGREDELLIGVRTCIRPLNDGHYREFLATMGSLGVDAFQGVKVLTPEFEKHQEQEMSSETIIELSRLREEYKTLGIRNYQIPNYLNQIYNNRAFRYEKPSTCWSAIVSPPLYGTNLMCCVLWDRITDHAYHYGVMEGEVGELDKMMTGERAKFIRASCPKNCVDCCAHNDNNFMEELWNELKNVEDVDDIEFLFEY